MKALKRLVAAIGGESLGGKVTDTGVSVLTAGEQVRWQQLRRKQARSGKSL